MIAHILWKYSNGDERKLLSEALFSIADVSFSGPECYHSMYPLQIAFPIGYAAQVIRTILDKNEKGETCTKEDLEDLSILLVHGVFPVEWEDKGPEVLLAAMNSDELGPILFDKLLTIKDAFYQVYSNTPLACQVHLPLSRVGYYAVIDIALAKIGRRVPANVKENVSPF